LAFSPIPEKTSYISFTALSATRRKRPELETLLLEIQSPPLQKLFGVVLESEIGERSPKLKSIGKGAELRNRLIHRPRHDPPTDDDAERYVNDIEVAIYHLLSHLYPNDAVIAFATQVASDRIAN